MKAGQFSKFRFIKILNLSIGDSFRDIVSGFDEYRHMKALKNWSQIYISFQNYLKFTPKSAKDFFSVA